jgi:preprotein translocase subunit SecE
MQKVQDVWRQFVEFLKEAWQELKKVYWPSRKETYAATLVVIVLVLIMAFYLAMIDFALTRAVQAILN